MRVLERQKEREKEREKEMEVKQTVSVRESMDKRDRERAGTLLPNSLNQSIARDHAKLRHLSLLVVSC